MVGDGLGSRGVPIRERAPAKVNLTFEVGPLRPDGFHAVQSVMAAVEWADEVRLHTVPGGGPDRVRVRGRAAPTGRDNLALRAVAAVREAQPDLPAIVVELHKRLPAGAGLGGGSSDAGAVLRALARLRGTFRTEALAPGLGSDVPFFAAALPVALATGRGEQLTPLPPLPADWRLVLVLPPFSLSTRLVYRRLDALRGGRVPTLGNASERLAQALVAYAAGGGGTTGEQALMECLDRVENDLWPAALSLRPALRSVHGRLRAAVGPAVPVALTGSGSALFAVMTNGAGAAAAAQGLRRQGIWARVVRPLGAADGR
jgi:4-diphosphocytidyl-2-C-methyl-D-erythritol kinase